MWRSIAARTRQVALNTGATTQNPKKVLSFQLDHSFSTPSLCKNPRFYAQLSATDPPDAGSDSHETELFIHGFSRNENTQIDDLDSRIENNDTQIENLVCFDENIVEKEPEEVLAEKVEKVVSVLDNVYDDSLESCLDALEIDFNEALVAKVLCTPNVWPKNKIGFYRWVVKKPKVKVSKDVVDALVFDMHGNNKKDVACALWDLVKEIGEKESSILSVENLNRLINYFWQSGNGKRALEVFNKFGEWGFVADEVTYYNMIGALCSSRCYDLACSVCEEMIAKGSLFGATCSSDDRIEEVGQVIRWLCKGNKPKVAHSVYVLAKEKDKYPPQSSVDFLISLLCQKDETVRLALEMLDDFKGETRKFGIKQFSAVIHGLSRMKDVDAVKTLLHKMISEGPPPGNAVFNSVINACSKNGDMEEAIGIMKLMESRGLKPDVYTYTVIMSGYANGGQMEKACEILSKAKKKHSKLSPATYHTLIRGYCKLEEFDRALDLLSEMKDFGVEPTVDEYNKMIQSLCLKALDWEKAEKLLEEMKEKGLHLNGITRALIRAVKDLEKEGLDNEGARIEA